MPSIDIRGTAGPAGAGAAGNGAGGEGVVFAKFRQWMRTGSPGDYEAFVSAAEGFPSIARFFGRQAGRGKGMAGGMPGASAVSAATAAAARMPSAPLKISVTAMPGSDTRLADAIGKLAAINEKILSVNSAEAAAMGRLAGAAGGAGGAARAAAPALGGLRWINGSPSVPESTAAKAAEAGRRAMAGAAPGRWINGAPTAPDTAARAAEAAKRLQASVAGPAPRWINGAPVPPSSGGGGSGRPPIFGFLTGGGRGGGWWGTAGGIIGGAAGGLIGGLATLPAGGEGAIPGAMAGWTAGQIGGRIVGGVFKGGAAGIASAAALVAAGRPWASYATSMMGPSIAGGYPYASWLHAVMPGRGRVAPGLAALGVSPQEALRLAGQFPWYASSAAAERAIVEQMAKARFTPGLSMLSPAGQVQASSFAFRYGLMAGGGPAEQMSRWQKWAGQQMTAARAAGTSPSGYLSAIESGVGMGTGPASARAISAYIAPYFARGSGLGPRVAANFSQQALAGPYQALGRMTSNPLRMYAGTILSAKAAKAGLGAVIGKKALAGLQASTGGRKLISEWEASVKGNGAGNPISVRLLQSIMQAGFLLDPGAADRAWKSTLGPAFGAGHVAGMDLLGESWWLGMTPQALAFRTGPGMPAASVALNNPLDIRSGPNSFRQFSSIGAGFRAGDRLLQSYAKHGLNTVQGIISKWAPPSENNTKAYIANVSKWMHVKPGAKLNMADPATRAELLAAMSRQEHSNVRLTGGQVLADMNKGASFGAKSLSAYAPPGAINYSPRERALLLGMSGIMAGAGSGVLNGSDSVLAALQALVGGAGGGNGKAESENTKAIESLTIAIEKNNALLGRGSPLSAPVPAHAPVHKGAAR